MGTLVENELIWLNNFTLSNATKSHVIDRKRYAWERCCKTGSLFPKYNAFQIHRWAIFLGGITNSNKIFRKVNPFMNNGKSSCSQMFFKVGVLKNFTNLTGKNLCWGLFFNKVAGVTTCNFIKKRLKHRCFPVVIAKFLRAAFFIDTSVCCFYV